MELVSSKPGASATALRLTCSGQRRAVGAAVSSRPLWPSRICSSRRPRSSCWCSRSPGEASRRWSSGGGSGSTRPSGTGHLAPRVGERANAARHERVGAG